MEDIKAIQGSEKSFIYPSINKYLLINVFSTDV